MTTSHRAPSGGTLPGYGTRLEPQQNVNNCCVFRWKSTAELRVHSVAPRRIQNASAFLLVKYFAEHTLRIATLNPVEKRIIFGRALFARYPPGIAIVSAS